MDAYTGAEIIKEYAREPFSEDINNLIAGWNMKDRYLSSLDFFTNKVNVHLNMFSPLMLDQITCEIYGTYIVAIN